MMCAKISSPAVNYCIFGTAWGDAGIAWTQKGVCKLVLPGLKKPEIKKGILAGYVQAEPAGGDEIVEVIHGVKSYFAGGKRNLKARVDLSWATPFQKKVYRALMRIPYGRTRSYAEVAEMAGSPGACRAVGSANAVNRIPLIIPCHRVIRSDGSPGGFSAPGGVKIKKRLLDLESGR
jgi:methylated-DNA-[protein]-cysteine S-methyltransferase